MTGNVPVSKIGSGFSEGTKVRWAGHPSHRKDQRKSNQSGFMGQIGKGNSQEREV